MTQSITCVSHSAHTLHVNYGYTALKPILRKLHNTLIKTNELASAYLSTPVSVLMMSKYHTRTRPPVVSSTGTP